MTDAMHTVPASAPRPPDAAPAADATSHAGPATTRLSAFAIVFAVLLIAAVWLAVWADLRQKRRDDMEAEYRQNANLAIVLEEQTLRVIATVDQSTLRVRDDFRPGGPLPDMVTLARETGLTPDILVQLSLVDGAGHLAASNLDPTGEKSGHVDLNSREHVRVHMNPASMPADAPRPGPGGLFIGKPVLGKVSGKWTIQMSRRIGAGGQPPQGVVVASVNPSYFEDVFRRVKLGQGGAVALIGADLTMRARVVDGKSVGMGSALPRDGTFAQHAGGADATYLSISGIDGVPRMTALRRVADYPLYVSVSTSVETALKDWRTTRDVLCWLAAVFTVVVASATTSFVMGLRRLERTNEVLRVREAEAQAASEAKSAFLAAISHELRTPLTSIRGFSELMEHRLDQPRQREQAGLIRKAAEHLNQLLTEILDLTKIDAGAMEINPEPQDLRALVQGTSDFFTLSAQEKGLALSAQVAEDVPALVLCDGLRLKQILNNLMSNAVKFTPAGQVRLAVARQGDELHFRVEDTGPGIPPELHEVIFQKFRQGSARTSYEHGGTGLGLALSRSLAELMRGRLWVESAEGRGSRFTLALPLALPLPTPQG